MCLISLITLLSAEDRVEYFPLRIGGQFGIHNPGHDDYRNTALQNISAEVFIEPSYSISAQYTHSELEADPDIMDYHEDIRFLTLYFNRHQVLGDRLKSYVSIGLGQIKTVQDDILAYAFRGGVRLPVSRRAALDLSVTDHMEELSIPFLTFPDFDILMTGGGPHYLTFSIGLTFGLGNPKSGTVSRGWGRW